MHLLFVICLAVLLAFSWVGIVFAFKAALSAAEVQLPFSILFVYAGATFGLWSLIAGIMYGLNHA